MATSELTLSIKDSEEIVTHLAQHLAATLREVIVDEPDEKVRQRICEAADTFDTRASQIARDFLSRAS